MTLISSISGIRGTIGGKHGDGLGPIEVVRFTGRYYDKKGRHPIKTVICLPHICRIKSGTPLAKRECTEVRWFSPDEIRKMKLSYDHKQMLVDEGLI